MLISTRCFWYLINFQFTQNKWKYITKHQKLGELSIKDDQQHQVAIPRLETNKAQRTLGVCLAPDGNWNTKLEYLMSVTSDWKVWMAASCLSPTNATFSLKNVIMQKLCYPLVTTTFSLQQCSQIMAPILQQGLPKAGVVHTFPRDLTHGPLDYEGLEIPHLYTEQLIAHVQMLLCYGPSIANPTGMLIHATGEAMQLEIGFGGELLATPLSLAENVTPSWIKHVWTSMQECGVTLSIDFTDIPPQRHGDIEIM